VRPAEFENIEVHHRTGKRNDIHIEHCVVTLCHYDNRLRQLCPVKFAAKIESIVRHLRG
jgi:hypothetical protein